MRPIALFNWAICIISGLMLLGAIAFYILADPSKRFWNALLPLELIFIGLAALIMGLAVNAAIWAKTAFKRRYAEGMIKK